MCGRFVFTPGGKERFQKRFGVTNEVTLEDNYNFAPGQILPVVVRQSPNQAIPMRWGLVPFWAKDPRIGYQLINARAESLAYKPSFRKAFRTQRCLVPANGFYEWKRTNGKQPFYIHRQDNQMVSFAGMYDIWKDAEGKQLRTFTIITTRPNAIMAPIHNRMPVILKTEDEDNWLDKAEQNPNQLLLLLEPISEVGLEAYPVSKTVNSARNQGKQLIEPES